MCLYSLCARVPHLRVHVGNLFKICVLYEKKSANVMLVKRWLIELLLLFVCSFVLFVRLLFLWFNDVSCVPELCV